MGLFGSVPLDWNVALLEAVRAESTSPNTAVRNFAILHAAIHDGVNVVEGKYKAYTEHGGKCPDLDAGAVATGAAFRVAGVLYPSRMPVFEKVLGEFRDGFAGDKELLSKSLERGYGVADVILKLREDDGASTQVTYVPVEEVGKWRRTPNRFRPPEQPHWRYVRPFCIPSVEPFLPPPPPALVSKEYAEALEEVRKIGGKDSRFRTEEQSGIAKFWADFSYTESPPGHWNHIAGDIVRLENLPLVEAARLYALLNLSMADAGIVAWEAKYRYHFWRPVHSIRGAEKDGNPATRPDRTWEPLLESPPHPEYVSGHSTYSAAGARALELFMGKDHYDFVTHSDTLKGVSRKFLSFSACAEECGRSRIYGGIHYKFSNANGLVAGSRVAAFIFKTACQPASKWFIKHLKLTL
jgi:hypothetical protein